MLFRAPLGGVVSLFLVIKLSSGAMNAKISSASPPDGWIKGSGLFVVDEVRWWKVELSEYRDEWCGFFLSDTSISASLRVDGLRLGLPLVSDLASE